MTAAERLAQIEARANAATEGPWGWFGNTDVHSIYLATRHSGRKFVMRFKRWGMQDAQPMFRDDPGAHGLMVPASELAVYEVARDATSRKDDRVYRADLVAIRNPDAEFIAHARTDVPWLIEQVRFLRTDVPWLIEQVRFLLGELAAAVGDNEKKDAALRAVLALKSEYGAPRYVSSTDIETTIKEALNG